MAAIIINNVVFHHASVEDEEQREAGVIGDFDYVIVNLTETIEVAPGDTIQRAKTIGEEVKDTFTAEEKDTLAKAYQAIQRVAGVK